MRCEMIPGGGLGPPETGKLIDAVVQPLAQLIVAERDAVDRDYCETGGEAAVLREVEQGRDQLAPGEVACAPENDEHRRIKLFRGFHRIHAFCSHFV